jgi:selenide, water dikinase
MRWSWPAARIARRVRALAAQGFVTGASGRNWAGYGKEIELPAGFAAEDKALLTDPQTSGGLLVSCDASAVGEVLDVFRRHGFADAAEIGSVQAYGGGARLIVR